MLIRKAFKFRLKTNHRQTALLNAFAGMSRFLWNKALALNTDRLAQGQRILRYYELDFWSKLWKKSEEYGFLKDCPSQVLQQKLKDLDKAYQDAFDKKQVNKRLPVFKKKGQGDSFRIPQGFKIEGRRIFLPKIGWVAFRHSQKITGLPKNVTISRCGTFWFVSIQTEYISEEPRHPSQSLVGIDMGVARFASLSTGEHISPIHSFRKSEQKLKKAQRKLKNKTKFSNNWKKQQIKIQKIHAHIANTRKDFLHKASSAISKNHAIIVLEDLKVKNMSASARGDLDNPGKKVKAKSGLNKSILDQGWGEFSRQLEYKQAWLGGEVLYVNPKYTSQTCPHCFQVSKENRQTQMHFECIVCAYQGHADTGGFDKHRKGRTCPVSLWRYWSGYATSPGTPSSDKLSLGILFL